MITVEDCIDVFKLIFFISRDDEIEPKEALRQIGNGAFEIVKTYEDYKKLKE